MGKLVRIRDVSSGRGDQHALDVVSGDASYVPLELASNAEALTGTDTNKLIAPASLAAAISAAAVPTASTDVAGKVELATSAETIAVTSQALAVTPFGLGAAIAKLDIISFMGSSGSGACTATGVAHDDVVFGVAGMSTGVLGGFTNKFESVITVNDQIQQIVADDLSLNAYMALIYRPS